MKENSTTDPMVLQLGKNTPVISKNSRYNNHLTETFSPLFNELPNDSKRIISLRNNESCIAWLGYTVLSAKNSKYPGEALLITACSGPDKQLHYLLQQLLMHSWETGAHAAFVQSDNELFTKTGFINYPEPFNINGIELACKMKIMELSWEGMKKVEGKEWLTEK